MLNIASSLYLREELQHCFEMRGCSSLITLISLSLVKNTEIKAHDKYPGKDPNI